MRECGDGKVAGRTFASSSACFAFSCSGYKGEGSSEMCAQPVARQRQLTAGVARCLIGADLCGHRVALGDALLGELSRRE